MPAKAAPGPLHPVDFGDFPSLLEPLLAWFHEHGDVVRFETPEGETGYSIASPEHAARVLRDNAENYTRGAGVERVRLMLPGGLLVDEGECWQRHRAMAAPLFRRSALDALEDRIHAAALRSQSVWLESARRGEALDLTAATSEYALDCTLAGLFGDDPADQDPFFPLAREQNRDLAFARRFRALRPVVAELLERRRTAPSMMADYLGTLLEMRDSGGRPYEEDELIDQILTLIIAGHETTASALAWIWLLLAEQPRVAAKLQAELDAAHAAGPFDAKSQELPYLDGVIREGLRLYPPVWLVTRRAKASDDVGGFEIPAGAQVYILLFALLRHPRHWPSPETFDPDRFALATPPRHPLSYLPFGVGPRRCIGERLALLELRSHLVHVASVVTLEAAGARNVAMDAQINLRPAGTVRIVPRLRDGSAERGARSRS